MKKAVMHETSVRAVVPMDPLGDVVICGLPGLVIAFDGSAYLDPEHARHTFEYMKTIDVLHMYLLMEDKELPPQTKTVLEQGARDSGITLQWMPIVDFGKPDILFEQQWKSERPVRLKMLKDRASIAVACLHGAGRSGMMAAAIRAECGLAPTQAVRYVRRSYEDAVGSLTQEKWVAGGSYLS